MKDDESGESVTRPLHRLCIVLPTVGLAAALLMLTSTVGMPQTLNDVTDIIADRIVFNDQTGRLTGEGNVRFIAEDWQIRSKSFRYEEDRILIEGPIHATDREGAVLLIEQADIDSGRMQTILQGVRLLVRDRQLAAATYTEDADGNIIIRDALVTGCRICKPGEQPLWHFRASAMVIPAGSRRAYLKDPVLHVGAFELGGSPWLSVPVDDGRYSGFLSPILNYADVDGASIQLPYFLTLGDHANLTLTPGLSSRGRAGLGYEYTHHFAVGRLDFEGARNRKPSDETFIEEYTDVSSEWRFTDSLTATASHSSDNEGDHEHVPGVYRGVQDLTVATLTHRTDRALITTDIVRANPPATLGTNRMTSHIGTGVRYEIQAGGFDLGFRGTVAETRIEDADLRAPNPRPRLPKKEGDEDPPIPELAIRQYGLTGTLARQIRLDSGVVARFSLLGSLDRWRWQEGRGKREDPGADPPKEKYIKDQNGNIKIDETAARANLDDRVAAIDLSLPLVRNGGGRAEVLEPFVQLVYAKDRTTELPQLPDSQIMLDAGNLRSLDRFANDSLRERGLRANLGVKLTGFLDSGTTYEASVGTVYRREYDRDAALAELETDEVGSAGMSGQEEPTDIQDHHADFVDRMEHVVSAGVRTPGGLDVSQTLHVSKTRRIRSAQSIVAYGDEQRTLSALLAWRRPTMTRDGYWGYTLDGTGKLSDRVSLGLSHSMGSEPESAVKSGVNLLYRHQCARFIFGVERTAYRASSKPVDLEASLSIRLGGFRTLSASGEDVCG